MPMKRHLYPKNWDRIALTIKTAAGWHCQQCGKPCRPPGIPLNQTGDWLQSNHPQWHNPPIKPHRHTLTVAHLNHQPGDCRPENLRAWCAPCHLAYDAPKHRERAAQTRRQQKPRRESIGGA